MSALRVTQSSTQYAAINRVQSAAQRLAALQNQLSSGQRISKPSDDPAGTTTALNLQSQIARNKQYAASSSDAIAYLSNADTAYQNIQTQVQAARTLVVQGMNTGANTPLSSSALADQIDALRSGILALANTTYNGQAVFGGTTSSSTAFDSSGNYSGDSGAVTRLIGPNNTVQLNQTGTDVFGPDGDNIFTTLANVSAALRSDPTTLAPQLNKIDAALNSISENQAKEGAVYSAVQTAQTAQTSSATSLSGRLADVAEIDFAQTVIDVTSANTAYQAALQTTATISQRSLMDFLK